MNLPHPGSPSRGELRRAHVTGLTRKAASSKRGLLTYKFGLENNHYLQLLGELLLLMYSIIIHHLANRLHARQKRASLKRRPTHLSLSSSSSPSSGATPSQSADVEIHKDRLLACPPHHTASSTRSISTQSTATKWTGQHPASALSKSTAQIWVQQIPSLSLDCRS